MKILSYAIKNGMIRVVTDNPGRTDFVYRADRFESKAELMAEIELSIAGGNKKKSHFEAKLNKLTGELDA